MKTLRIITFILAAMLALAASAADRRPITPQDLWACKRLGSPAVSPDGRTAVFTVQEWSIEKNKSSTNLWWIDLDGGTPRRLTTADASDGSPVWAPDGTRIAFVSKRGEDEVNALYVIRADGGEAEKILELPHAVSNPRWLPDGRHVIVGTQVIRDLAGSLSKADLAAMKKELKRRKDSKVSAKVTEDRQYRHWDHYLPENVARRLVRVNVETREIRDLTPQWMQLFQNSGDVNFDVSPDGGSVALVLNSTPPPFREESNHDIYLLSADGSGAPVNLTADNKGMDSSPVFSPDGRSIFYSRTEETIHNGEFRRLWRHDLATGKNIPLTEGLDYAIGDVEVSEDGKTLWLLAEEKGLVPVFRMNADGTGLGPVYRSGTASGLVVRGRSVVFLNDTTSRPNELFVLDPATGAARQLTNFNEELLAQLNLGKVESYGFTGAAGDPIQGWLTLPPDYDPQKTYPLVQLMHGGPHTMASDSWSYRWNSHVFAAAGYIVTRVNRHGSTGFGEKFAMSIVNQWGDMPLEDILKSTDHLLARFPNIDPKRIAAGGGSYGGYLAAWILGHTDRFACLINHAGVNNTYSQYAADGTHGFTQVMGGTPWANVEGMQERNPMFYAKNFKTPMLITHGKLDYRVPYGHSLELYGVLQAMGVPSRLVVYPDENHWILSPQNAIYWNYEVQNWLARHLGGNPIPKPSFDAEQN